MNCSVQLHFGQLVYSKGIVKEKRNKVNYRYYVRVCWEIRESHCVSCVGAGTLRHITV